MKTKKTINASSEKLRTEFTIREVREINPAFVGLSEYGTSASTMLTLNHLKCKSIYADSVQFAKALNKQWATKDEVGKFVYDEDGGLQFTPEALEELNEQWELFLDTKVTISFIPFVLSQITVRVFKNGRHEQVKPDLPAKFTTPLVEYGILTIPDLEDFTTEV